MNSPRTAFEHGVAIAFSAIVLGAATSSAQQSSGHWWAASVYYGGSPTATGGGVGSLMHPPELIGGSLKIRLGQGPWWIGVDLDDFMARPTAAGLDAIIAQSGNPGLHAENGGAYYMIVTSISLRYDAWTRGAFTAYEVASAGRVGTSADIYGRNCTFGGCEEDPASVSLPGVRAAASVGGGVLVRLADLVPEFRRFPVSIHVEARLATIGTNHGRMLSAPLLAGVTW